MRPALYWIVRASHTEWQFRDGLLRTSGWIHNLWRRGEFDVLRDCNIRPRHLGVSPLDLHSLLIAVAGRIGGAR